MSLLVLSGIIAGSAHVVTGPDHLAAVAPMVAEKPERGFFLGLRWGIGHGLGVLLLGGGGLLLKEYINVGVISEYSEALVGWLLIAIGCWTLWKSRKVVVHSHEHVENKVEEMHHSHVHVHPPKDHDVKIVFGMGMLHGAAGTGHLLGVLPSLLLSQMDAVIYLGSYFCAAVISMASFGWLMSKLVSSADGIQVWVRGFALLAIIIGIFWIWSSMGVVETH
jgi:putative Mn2+ efflux pump MntP